MADSSLNSMFSDWMPTGYFNVSNPDSLQYYNPATDNEGSRYDEILSGRPEVRGALDFIKSGKMPISGWFERTIQGAPGSSQVVQRDDSGKDISGTFATHINDDSPFWLGANLAGGIAVGATNPSTLGKALYGGFSGAGNTLGTDVSALTGGTLGALGAWKPDVSGFMGYTGNYSDAINGAAYGGATSALSGGKPLQGAVIGALPSLASSLGNSSMDSPLGKNYSTAPGFQQNNVAEITGNAPQQSFAPWSGDMYAGTAPPQEKQNSLFESSGLNDFFGGISKYFPDTKQGWGDMAQGLAGLYLGYRQRRDAENILNAMSGRRQGYEKNLRASLQARDAASGRRSNYEGREAQLQGELAKLDMSSAPLMMQLNNQSNSGLFNMLGSGLRWGGKSGLFGDSYNPHVKEVEPPPSASLSMPSYGLNGMFGNLLTASYEQPQQPMSLVDLWKRQNPSNGQWGGL